MQGDFVPRCTFRSWVWIEKGPDEPKKDGSWGPSHKFHGAPACGAPATISDGHGNHWCLSHAPRKPRDGDSRDPLSVAGSHRYRYLV
jgi:hypothetical protein